MRERANSSYMGDATVTVTTLPLLKSARKRVVSKGIGSPRLQILKYQVKLLIYHLSPSLQVKLLIYLLSPNPQEK